MLTFISQITDKAEWDRKVFDESIVSKWREEANRQLWGAEEDVVLSQRMFDFVGSPFKLGTAITPQQIPLLTFGSA